MALINVNPPALLYNVQPLNVFVSPLLPVGVTDAPQRVLAVKLELVTVSKLFWLA